MVPPLQETERCLQLTMDVAGNFTDVFQIEIMTDPTDPAEHFFSSWCEKLIVPILDYLNL